MSERKLETNSLWIVKNELKLEKKAELNESHA
jgi:hypothetical protein